MLDARRLVESLMAIAGIWLLFRQLPDYVASIYFWALSPAIIETSEVPFLALQTVHISTSVAAGLLLILVRRPVGRWLYPQAAEVPVSGQSLLSAGIAIVACYFVISGVVEVGTYQIWRPLGFSSDTYSLWRGTLSIAAGAVLFISSVWLSRFWARLERRANGGV